jgi:hypothetical protein
MPRFRDFNKKQFKNPFFTKQKKSRLFSWIAGVVVVLVLAGSACAVVFSPLARISRIEVKGTKTISSDLVSSVARNEISGFWLGIIPKDNYFFINADRIRDSVLASGLPFRSVDVKTGFKTITVSVTELEASVRVVGGAGSYVLDQDGKVMRVAAPGEGDNLIAVSFSDPNKIFGIGDAILSPSQMNFIIDLHKYFATQAGIHDKIINVDPDNSSLDVVTDEGWYAIFDPDVDLNEQLKSLSSVINGKFGPEARKNLLYIDARFGDRVFYKFKGPSAQ